MPYSLSISHVGIFVKDMQPMVDFYTRFMGFAIADRGPRPGGEIVFLTRDPREHHQLVLASGRPADMNFNVVNQISFRVDSLATLRQMHEGLKGEAVKEITTLTHGNALSVYFRDPEYNRIELLIDTPWYVPQPHRLQVDIMQTDEQLWAGIEKNCRGMPGFKSRKDWMAEIEQKIAKATQARRQAAVH